MVFSLYHILQMRALGISARLDQVFDAPHAVKEVLISQFGLDSSVCFLNFPCRYTVHLNTLEAPIVKHKKLNN